VAAGIGDALLAGVAVAGEFGKAVVPVVVEAVVGRQVDDHRIAATRRQALDARARLAVRQREDARIGVEIPERLVRDIGVAQRARVPGDVRRYRLAVELARGHDRQLEPRVPGDQPDQLRTGVAARADDADRLLVSHGPSLRLLADRARPAPGI